MTFLGLKRQKFCNGKRNVATKHLCIYSMPCYTAITAGAL